MFKAIGKITLNLILIFMVEDLVRAAVRLVHGERGRRPRS